MAYDTADTRTMLRRYDARQNRKKIKSIYVDPGKSGKSRICFSVLKVLEGIDPKDVVEGTEKFNPRDKNNPRPVSPNTITKWRMDPKKGGTLYPQTRTMERVLAARGYKLVVAPASGPDVLE